MSIAAASPFNGSDGLGYRSNCGRKTSKMLIISYMGDQVWLMTSRQTDPELDKVLAWTAAFTVDAKHLQLVNVRMKNAVDEADTGALIRVLIW